MSIPVHPSLADRGVVEIHGLTSKTATHDELLALADSVLPTIEQQEFVDAAVRYITALVTSFKDLRTGRVIRVAKAGSYFKGTAISFCFDVDLVVQFVDANLDLAMSQMVNDLHKCFIPEQQANSIETNVAIRELNMRKYSVELKLGHRDHQHLDLKVDVLCSIDVLEGTECVHLDGFVNQAGRDRQVEALGTVFLYDDKFTLNRDRRRMFQPLVSEAAVFDMRNAHENVRRLVRLLKLWAWSNVCTRDMATALSSVMEQVALYVWDGCRQDQWSLDLLFSRAIQQLSTITNMRIGTSPRKAVQKECPRLVHKCDPLNNLLDTVDSRIFSAGYQQALQSAALASIATAEQPVRWLFKVPSAAPLRTYRLRAMIQVFPNVHCAAPMSHTDDVDTRSTHLHRLLASFLTLSVRAHYADFGTAFANGQMRYSELGCDLFGRKSADARKPQVSYDVDPAELMPDDPMPDVLGDVVRVLSGVYRFNHWKPALGEAELGKNAQLTLVRVPLPFGVASNGRGPGNEVQPSGMVVLYVYHFVPNVLSNYAPKLD